MDEEPCRVSNLPHAFYTALVIQALRMRKADPYRSTAFVFRNSIVTQCHNRIPAIDKAVRKSTKGVSVSKQLAIEAVEYAGHAGVDCTFRETR